jgi:hypothetical protein
MLEPGEVAVEHLVGHPDVQVVVVIGVLVILTAVVELIRRLIEVVPNRDVRVALQEVGLADGELDRVGRGGGARGGGRPPPPPARAAPAPAPPPTPRCRSWPPASTSR